MNRSLIGEREILKNVAVENRCLNRIFPSFLRHFPRFALHPESQKDALKHKGFSVCARLCISPVCGDIDGSAYPCINLQGTGLLKPGAEMGGPEASWNADWLEAALARLYSDDSHLVDVGRERPAAARLAAHLRDVLLEAGYLGMFPDIRIDTDVGHEGDDLKRDAEGKQVIPDIIVHVPGKAGPNVAALEIKGWWNPATPERDLTKLKGYMQNQLYSSAYFIRLEKRAATITAVK